MKKCSLTLSFLIFLAAILVVPNTFAQSKKGSKKSEEVFNKGETTIKNPLDLRDPFKKKRKRLGRRKKRYQGYLTDGKYSNLPSIQSFPLEQIRIVGIFLGEKRRALAKIGATDGTVSPETYMIREGMKIGENDAEVKAIVPGGIVLVEKIRNVYNQDEYIETIIPVSSN
jgi:Tfp pilus assembly protein PilP